jgi:hypothetical protein
LQISENGDFQNENFCKSLKMEQKSFEIRSNESKQSNDSKQDAGTETHVSLKKTHVGVSLPKSLSHLAPKTKDESEENPNIKMLKEKLKDPAYEDFKDFILQEIESWKKQNKP